MKIGNVKNKRGNNLENTINGSMWSSTPTTKTKMIRVGVDDHVDPSNKGITLIALIITIILMLILAGVVLNLTIGENGLFGTAKYAAKKWNNSVEQENAEIDELYAYINGETLPENTKDTVAGTLVAVPDNWKTNTPAYIQTSDGREVVSSKKVSTVQAVATGEGETVPVPLGFYYVGGKISTGVVISDNPQDKNKYKNETEIPSGIEAILNEDGSVKEVKETLVGNQFVWVPCKEEDYVKTNWGQGNGESDAYWDATTYKGEKIQVKKYGGFYIARFEAGLASNIEATKDTQQHIGSNKIYNKEGKPLSKAGLVPWNFIDWNMSKNNAESMYKTNYVESGLITGTQWDVMINWMTDKNTQELTDSKKWGNYATSSLKINLGRTSYCYVNGSWYQEAFAKKWVSGTVRPQATINKTSYMLTTGASNEARKKNIYDAAGNLWEFTEEVAINSTSQYCICRGTDFTMQSLSVCYRARGGTDNGSMNVGFRVVLYMK